jgi:F-type H+-transporting ATPase subunit b
MRRNLLRSLGAAVAAAAAAAGPALAAEGGGMPQLNVHDFAPQIVWLAILFIGLYVLMAKVALPKVGAALQLRADRIKEDLDRAASLKAETERIIAAYEKARTEARNQAAAVGRETAAALAQQSADRQAKVSADLTAKIKSAEANIAGARDKAMGEIRNVAADIASDAARRLVGLQIGPADAQQAVAAVLKERR